MTVFEILTLIAIVFGPFGAVFIQRKISDFEEKRVRKLFIFKNLMATRGNPLDVMHVQSLNMIDLEFTNKNKKETLVRECWKELNDVFQSWPQPPQDQNSRHEYKANLLSQENKREEKLVDLLYAMSQCLNYDFDKTHLRRGCYRPEAHNTVDNEQALIRYGMIQLLSNSRALSIRIDSGEEVL